MKDCWFFLKLFKPHGIWLAGGILLSLLTALASIALLTFIRLVYQRFRDSGISRS